MPDASDKDKIKVIIDRDTIIPDDMSQEELDGLVAELERLANSGELMENSESLSDIEIEELIRVYEDKPIH